MIWKKLLSQSGLWNLRYRNWCYYSQFPWSFRRPLDSSSLWSIFPTHFHTHIPHRLQLEIERIVLLHASMTIDDTMQIFIDVLLAVKLRIHNILWHVKISGRNWKIKAWTLRNTCDNSLRWSHWTIALCVKHLQQIGVANFINSDYRANSNWHMRLTRIIETSNLIKFWKLILQNKLYLVVRVTHFGQSNWPYSACSTSLIVITWRQRVHLYFTTILLRSDSKSGSEEWTPLLSFPSLRKFISSMQRKGFDSSGWYEYS